MTIVDTYAEGWRQPPVRPEREDLHLAAFDRSVVQIELRPARDELPRAPPTLVDGPGDGHRSQSPATLVVAAHLSRGDPRRGDVVAREAGIT